MEEGNLQKNLLTGSVLVLKSRKNKNTLEILITSMQAEMQVGREVK